VCGEVVGRLEGGARIERLGEVSAQSARVEAAP